MSESSAGERAEQLDELLGAYALDAVSADERAEIEEYLQVNPRARAEVDAHQEVAALLAWTGMTAPDGLWDRISDEIDGAAPALSGELAAVLSFDAAAARPSDEVVAQRRHARRRRRITRNLTAWAGVSVAAALIAVVVVNIVQDRETTVSPIAAAADAARNDRDSVRANLVSADGQVGGQAVIDPDGHGYLLADQLPELPDDRTYQLWGVIGGNVISLGVLGHAPEIETFTVDGPITQLVISNEVAGGVVTNANLDGSFAGTLT